MYFTVTAAILAFASSVLAQTAGFNPITKPTKDEVIPAGEKYGIEWEPSGNYTGTVTLSLLGGSSPSTLQDLAVIAAGVASDDGTYEWAVDKSLGKAKTYGIRLSLDSDKNIFQYSFPFSIKEASGSTDDTSSPTSKSATGSGTTSAPTSSTTGGSVSNDTTITSMTTITSSTAQSNLSTTASASRVTLTTSTGTTRASTSATAISSNPAVVVGASSFALFGGLAMAVFAL